MPFDGKLYRIQSCGKLKNEKEKKELCFQWTVKFIDGDNDAFEFALSPKKDLINTKVKFDRISNIKLFFCGV